MHYFKKTNSPFVKFMTKGLSLQYLILLIIPDTASKYSILTGQMHHCYCHNDYHQIHLPDATYQQTSLYIYSHCSNLLP